MRTLTRANTMKTLTRAVKMVTNKRRTIKALEAAYGPIDVEGAKRVAAFPELGLAYNRIKKSANTSTMILLNQISSGEIVKGNAAKTTAQNLFELSADEISDVKSMTLFVVIRNPYARVLSAFLGKMPRQSYQKKHGAFEMTPDGFGKFLHWLEGGGLTGDPHWDLQTKLMMLPLDRYDAVIRLESYNQSMRELIESCGLTVPEGALEDYYATYRGHETNARSKLAQFYTKERVEIVRRLFSEDFRALGYSTEFPEPMSF